MAPRLARAIQVQRITAAGIPPFQEIRLIGIEDSAAPVTAARALRQGRRTEIAKHRTLADAHTGHKGMARLERTPVRGIMATNGRLSETSRIVSRRGRFGALHLLKRSLATTL
jgi:hypothetical protein